MLHVLIRVYLLSLLFFEFFQNDDLEEEEEEESPLGRKLMTVTLGEFQKCLKPACQAEVQVA